MRHELLTEDPDLQQAVEDLLPVAEELRVRSSRIIGMAEGNARTAAQRMIADCYSRIAARGARIAISGPALVEILNAILDATARRGRAAPAGDTSRTLLNAVAEAVAREETAQAGLSAAIAEAKSAAEHRVATEEACKAFGIARIRR